jgi:CRP-like cAMP-binding protein
MLQGLDGDLKALAAELAAAQDAVRGEVATLTEELIAAKLLIAEKEEIIERLRRERAPKVRDEAAATADELRALLASERAHHKKQLDDAHARLAEVVPLPMSSPDSTRDLSTPRFSPEKQKGKMFSRAVTKASTLKQRARDAYKARRKVVREQSVDQLLANAPLFASLSMDERADLADQCITAEFRKGEVISQMGDYSDQMCLVARGAVRLSVEGTEVAAVEPGGSFGDDSLMHDLRRSSTATASTDIVKLVCVPRRALREILRGERDTRSLWDAYRSYEESLLKRLVQDVESAKTRQEYLIALGRHRATASLIPLEPTSKMLQRGGKDARRKQFIVDLRRESSLIVDNERYPLDNEKDFERFMELLEGLAHKAASAPLSNDRSAVQLPPSLVGFLPLLFAEDAEHVEDHAQERRAADPARVDSILLQLLASCSRTTSGGESFARCHELFGSGDVVVLTPSPELTSPTRIRVLRDDLVMLTSTNTYRVQHADERKIVRGTGYSTWCLLVTSVVEVLDLSDEDGSVRHMSISFYHPGAENAIRMQAEDSPVSPARDLSAAASSREEAAPL